MCINLIIIIIIIIIIITYTFTHLSRLRSFGSFDFTRIQYFGIPFIMT